MQKNQSLGDSFKLLIGLAEIHVPRMWVERMSDDTDNQVDSQLNSLFMFLSTVCLPFIAGWIRASMSSSWGCDRFVTGYLGSL